MTTCDPLPIQAGMMALEMANELYRQVAEFGDREIKIPDQMQHDWLRDLTDVEFDGDREKFVLVAE